MAHAASEPVTAASVSLSAKDLIRVCRGGASFRNGTAVGRIKAKTTETNLVRISYTRTDGKFFAYDCKVEGNQVRFRMIDEAGPGSGPGSWSGRGSKTTFVLLRAEIEFTDDFFDGSTDVDRVKI
ncbi:hypothetical protein [Sphingopyxis terrae]|uniref:hypothetical protein n=1 Tax=Sphingopyxis terrae TaxID=33052 RepID=UPI002A0E8111|nr:hypothetical protein [Sphingopyxis terrae]MDX8357759.1 hypothetical protein [Sphingopyxis terrae]